MEIVHNPHVTLATVKSYISCSHYSRTIISNDTANVVNFALPYKENAQVTS